jgi:tetratricopeptide (TPR) repeat protein
VRQKDGRNGVRLRFSIPLALMAVACSAQAGPLQEAEKELFAARYGNAAKLYAAALAADPADSRAYYGLVRSLIGDHRSGEAYAVAAKALQRNPQTPDTQTAAGMAAFRSGDIAKAGEYFRAALKLDPDHAGALRGLASVETAICRFKTARDLLLAAWRSSPGDPQLTIAHAETLKGAERVKALQEALATLDPDSQEARGLRASIANGLAMGGRQPRRLTSPYVGSKIKLFTLSGGGSQARGVGIRVQFNERNTALLLLDSGASGIGVSAQLAGRARLEKLGNQNTEVRGIGDGRPQSSEAYLASQVRIGGVEFADYPIAVFGAARSELYDGLIGADVFAGFLATIDFPKLEISLEPRPGGPPPASAEPVDAASEPSPGFHRAFRFGHHLAVPASVNGGRPTLFVIDTGSTETLIDAATAREFKAMLSDGPVVRGFQGAVNRPLRALPLSLAFAGFRQDSPSLSATDLEKLSDAEGIALGGLLGMPSIGQLALTLDYREGTVRFERRK